jgi:hypothetical protein
MFSSTNYNTKSPRVIIEDISRFLMEPKVVFSLSSMKSEWDLELWKY